MQLDVVTLFPDSLDWFKGQRHVRNALEAGHEVRALDPRPFTPLTGRQVDDTPFGGGALKCIGSVFGTLEIKTILHRLLRSYHLGLPRPGYKPVWDYGGMPVPKDGMPIVLRPL